MSPKVIGWNAGTVNFTAASGNPPHARFIRTIGDFLVLGGLSTDEKAIRWCDINDPTNWSTLLSDFQSFPDGDRITGLEGGEEGFILQEKAVRRMTFIPGADEVFRFQRLENAKGNIAPYSSTTIGQVVYYTSNDGFYAISTANGLRPIGDQKVNKWFEAHRDTGRFFTGRCAADRRFTNSILSAVDTSEPSFCNPSRGPTSTIVILRGIYANSTSVASA